MALHLRITGRVQGVGYRVAFLHEAEKRGLSGWVRNRLDGSVEAIVDGDAGALAQIQAWAGAGPPGASVRQVLATQCDPGSVRAGAMEIRPTA